MSNPTELPDLDKMEALARAATPGPWDVNQAAAMQGGRLVVDELYVYSPEMRNVAIAADIADPVTGEMSKANADYIAAANPAAVLALIELARRAQPEGEAPQAEPEFKLQPAVYFPTKADIGKPLTLTVDRTGRSTFGVADSASAAQHAESGKEVAAKPPFPISDDEMAALRRFWECATDDEGYDVSKRMMQRLADMGLVQRKSGSYYMSTDFGLYVLGEYTAERAAHLDGGQEGSESNG